jgi:hypothetical protein
MPPHAESQRGRAPYVDATRNKIYDAQQSTSLKDLNYFSTRFVADKSTANKYLKVFDQVSS